MARSGGRANRSTAAPFKVCTDCRRRWGSRARFLGDPDLLLVGYQVNVVDPDQGMFLFTHDVPACGTTVAMTALAFRDLYTGPVFKEWLVPGEKNCPGCCLYQNNLLPCPARCNCAYVREILQRIKTWPRRKRPGAKGKASP